MLTWPQPAKKFQFYQIAKRANYNTIEKMLLFNCDDVIKDPELIEMIYGLALFRSNERIISLVNLFVRENKIKINRYNVLDRIYHGVLIKNNDEAELFLTRCPSRRDEPNYASFNEQTELQLNYIHKYWNMFEVKNY